MKQPHIIVFNPDQWRGDVLGHMGNPAAVTPNLDWFVQEDAVSFSAAFCQNPVCTPSRCSFMSGWYPHVRGHRTIYHMLHPEHGEPNLMKILKEDGYFVWWKGENDLVPGHRRTLNRTAISVSGLRKRTTSDGTGERFQRERGRTLFTARTTSNYRRCTLPHQGRHVPHNNSQVRQATLRTG